MPEQPLAPLSLGSKTGLSPAGHYKKHMGTSFRDICQDVQDGPKYNLDDEIVLVKGLIVQLIKKMDEGEVRTHEITSVIKTLRETLKQAAEFEGMYPVNRLKAWAVQFMRIVREEVKDDAVIQRITARAGSTTL